MSIIRISLIPAMLCMAVAATGVFADDTSLTRSAWSPAPVQVDPKLRDPQVRRGQEVFRARCRICHGAIPKETVAGGLPPMPGTQALQVRYQGEKPAMLEQRTDLTPAFVKAIVRNGLNSMPFFRPTEVTNADLEALCAYLSRKRH